MSKGGEVRLFFMEKPTSLSTEKETKRDKTGRSSLEIQVNVNLCLFLLSRADFLTSGSSSLCDGSEARSSPPHDAAIFGARPPEMLQKGKARSLGCAGVTTGARGGRVTVSSTGVELPSCLGRLLLSRSSGWGELAFVGVCFVCDHWCL